MSRAGAGGAGTGGRRTGGPRRAVDHGAVAGSNATPSTRASRPTSGSRPASCGASVTNSSSSRSRSTRSPIRCGPPSHRMSRAPSAEAISRTRRASTDRPRPATSIRTFGPGPADRSRRAPAAVVTMTTGTSGAESPGCDRSSEPLAVTTTVVGWAVVIPRRRRHSAKASAEARWTWRAVHSWVGAARTVPAPTRTTSAMARSSPITNRSGSKNPLISPPPDAPSVSNATTPSSVDTKFAITAGRSRRSGTRSSPS